MRCLALLVVFTIANPSLVLGEEYNPFLLKPLSRATLLHRAQDAKETKRAQRAAAAEQKAAERGAEARVTQRNGQQDAIGQGKPARAPREAAPLIPLGAAVFPETTFTPFQGSPVQGGNMFEFRTYAEPAQAPFRASVVGINVNSWLENPENFETLSNLAAQFPVNDLLNNLAHYSPGLLFNDPALTAKLLTADIYRPYLQALSNQPKLPPLFSQTKAAVAFTRNYHIYGAAAGNLPYFGVPSEGAERRINLGLLPGQLQEYAARLPDTDIFLVITINIIPNWLEEGWNVRQVNRQSAEILVYAFNRRGKILGSAGLPQDFMMKGSFITASQSVKSKVWQPSVPRIFFIWPSFKIINTPLPNSEKQAPGGSLPSAGTPYLKGIQKYILASITNLRARGEKPEQQLFDAAGRRTYQKVKAPSKTPPVFLAKRKLFLTGALPEENPTLVLNPKALGELDGSAPRFAFEEIALPEAPQKEAKQAPGTPSEKAEKEAQKAQQEAEKEARKAQQKAEKEAQKAQQKAEKEAQKAERRANTVSLLSDIPLPLEAPLTYRAQDAEQAAQQKAAKEAERAAAAQLRASEKAAKEAEQRAEKEAKESQRRALRLEKFADQQSELRTGREQRERISVNQGVLQRKYFPSNEKNKLQELVSLVSKGLKEAPFFTTNELHSITNTIPAYELESDPSVYHDLRKKYFSTAASSKIYKKAFVKETAALKKALRARLDDEQFWASLHKKAMQGNNLWTPELEKAYQLYRGQLKLRRQLELQRFAYQRDDEFIRDFNKEVLVFGQRELDDYKRRSKKPEVFAKRVIRNQENVRKSIERHTKKFGSLPYLTKKDKFQRAHIQAATEFTRVYSEYKKIIPENLQVSFLNTALDPVQLIRENREAWTGLAQRNRVPLEIIAFVEINHFLYPTKRFLLGLERKALRQYKSDMRFLNYEGFQLGLSGGWSFKTRAADRLDNL